MAEIKSSIELAMEKTKHLIMTEEEKREQEKREFENKIRGLLRRFRDRYLDKEDLIKEFKALKDASHKKTFLEILFDEIDLSAENRDIIDLLEGLCEISRERLEEEFEQLKKRFFEELEKREMIARERIRESLKEIGIEGDAVVINLQNWRAYEEIKGEVQEIFKRRLVELRERLSEAISYR